MVEIDRGPAQRRLVSAFSLNMVAEFPANIRVREVSLDEAREIAPSLTSAVGHPDAAQIFSALLGELVPFCRESITLNHGDEVLVGQYRGPRLPEGTTQLPEGAAIQWLIVMIE